jgi:hypothetical protein
MRHESSCGYCRAASFGAIAVTVLALALPWSAVHGQAATEPQAPSAWLSPTRVLVEQAIALEHGEGVARDQRRAGLLYCDAARAGDADAQFSLGWMYANGRGVPRDDEIAAGLFTLAAAQGHPHAAQMLRFVGAPGDRLPECMKPPLPPAIAAIEEDALWNLPPDKQRLAELVRDLAAKYDVDPRLALAVIAVESNFNPRAESPKNARGLMQLIPETAERFNVKNVFDPAENVRGGLAYLRWLLAYYRGRVTLAAAAYNAGERAVDYHRGVPPYPETQEYVRKIVRLFRADQHPYDATLTDPSPMLTASGRRRM